LLVVKNVRERLTTFLNKSRNAGGRRSVEDLGFIFPDADELCNVRNKGKKVIEQVKDISEEQPEERDISLEPESHSYTNQPNSGQTCDAMNDTLYGNAVDIGQRSGMQFTARYTVLVEDLPELEQSRELQRVIDLVEVSSNFCIADFQSRDRYHFFSSSTHYMRLVYLIALCFRSTLKGNGDIQGKLLCLLPGKNECTSIVAAGVTKMKLGPLIPRYFAHVQVVGRLLELVQEPQHFNGIISIEFSLHGVAKGFCRKAKIYGPLPGSLSGRPLI
jgi:hypothetical protein